MNSNPLPKPLVAGGAENADEKRAADLLRRALQQSDLPVHPAVGARMRVGVARGLRRRTLYRNRPLIFAAAGAAVAVLLLVWAPHWRSQSHQTLVAGTLMTVGSGVSRQLAAGSAVAAGQPVSCASATCEIDIAGGVRSVMRRDAVFSVTRPRLTQVHHGLVSFAVQPLAPGERFTVRGRETLVEVVGTAFSVEVSQAGATQVVVSEGIVRVVENEREAFVSAGQSWPGVLRAGLRGEPPQPAAAVAPEPPAQELAPSPDPSSSNSSRVREPPAERKNAAPSVRPRTPRTPPERRISPTQLLEQAASHIRGGELSAAKGIYQGMAARDGTTGELGLYMLAQLQLHYLGAPRAARGALAAMASRFPGGSLALERALAEIEVATALGECDAARAGVAAFAVAFPRATPMLEDARGRVVAGCGR